MAAMASAAITLALLLPLTHAFIDRQSIVSRYPIVRTALANESITPLMVGNGDFAYSVDNTGMQVLRPILPPTCQLLTRLTVLSSL